MLKIHPYLIDTPSLLKHLLSHEDSHVNEYCNRMNWQNFRRRDSVVDLNSFSDDHVPENVMFIWQATRVQYYNLLCNENTGIPCVNECIMIDMMNI